MAGIENLKNRIMQDGRERADKVLSDAKAQAQEMMRKAREKAATMVEEAKVKAEKMGDDRKERIISSARMDARNMKLTAKQETIDRIMNMAADTIMAMDKKEYTDFLEKLLVNSIETGDEEIVFSKADTERIDLGMIDRLNKKLISKGKKGALKISHEERNIKSGFLLINGGVEINCSIESQIRMIRDSIEGEIAGLLFENDHD